MISTGTMLLFTLLCCGGIVYSVEDDCPPGKWQCADKSCIPKNMRCNGLPQCVDGSDEVGCKACLEGMFKCRDGNCVDGRMACDGLPQCEDGSDEFDCPTPLNTVPPMAKIDVELGGTFTIICEAVGVPTLLIVWRLNWGSIATGYLVTTISKDGRGLLTVNDARYSDAGAYTCEDINNLEINYAIPDALVIVRRCPPGKWQCADKSCVPANMRCDGPLHCVDGSDEVGCEVTCRSDEFTCSDGKCVAGRMRCDSIPQCEDQSDENNCPCLEGMFQCRDGNCVDGRMACDGIPQCEDGSDEFGCPPPIITVPPVAKIEVELGGTFTIICEAVGVPTPQIVWRLNWGSIVTGYRVTTIRKDGSGVLTVHDARYSDAGAYTCEDIHRLAIPDALVIVRRCPPGKWQCADKSCVPANMRCDFPHQCVDCEVPCRPDQFICYDGNCVEGRMRCDGIPQCEDQSDENNCPCIEGMFQCRDGNSVDGKMACDGILQCEDGSDEFSCRQ